MLLQPKSVYRLMLASFLLVALPLMAGLLILLFQMDRLSGRMQMIVAQSASVMENSRLLTAQALSLKRSAEQFLILSDSDLLSRFREQRLLLEQSIDALMELPVDVTMYDSLERLRATEATLLASLEQIDSHRALGAGDVPKPTPPRPASLDQLSGLLEAIPLQAGEFVSLSRERMAAETRKSKESLILLLVILIPTAIILALISSSLINRPLKKVISLIRRLGEGEFPDDTHIGGPRNIATLGEQLQWLSDRLSQIEQQKVTFLQNISHELKTPLTAIREGTELIEEEITGTLNDEQREILDIINQNTRLLQNQLESLLDFNLALTMDEPYPRVPVNIKLVIEKLLDKLHLILKSRQISVEHETPPARIVGNQAQLETLFENILTNAIKYSPRGGTIHIATTVNDDGINIIVKDNGPGFPEEEREDVFKPFFQGKNKPDSHIKGTGLGLSIARRYADLHGGRIEVSNGGVGAMVSVMLPANQPFAEKTADEA